MSALQATVVTDPSESMGLGHKELSRFSASEIRLAIAQLVADNKIELAHPLSEAGLSLYPQNEDMLAISALLAEVREDWMNALDYLEQLKEVQGRTAPIGTWLHLVRVHRCLCQPHQAIQAAQNGLDLHPGQADLQKELQDLQAQIQGLTEGLTDHGQH